MPLLNFKSRFVEPIRTGRKHHTIRAERKIPVKPGDLLYLYCGARTKNCFRILPEPQTCTKVQQIVIRPSGDVLYGPDVLVDSTELDSSEKYRLAVADGFYDFAEMMEFWDGRLPFKGQIIHWK